MRPVNLVFDYVHPTVSYARLYTYAYTVAIPSDGGASNEGVQDRRGLPSFAPVRDIRTPRPPSRALPSVNTGPAGLHPHGRIRRHRTIRTRGRRGTSASSTPD